MRPSPALLLLLGCHAPEIATRLPEGPPPIDPAALLRDGAHVPLPEGFARAPTHPPPPGPEANAMAPLGAEITGARFDDSRGAELLDALAEEDPDEVATYGVGVLTYGEVFDASDAEGESLGICKNPHMILEFEEDGQSWELSTNIWSFLHLRSDVEAMWMSLSEDCRAGVEAAVGDVEAAEEAGACTEAEVRGFFPEDGDCRACVGERGALTSCLDEGVCLEETPLVEKYSRGWYEWATAEVVACAPDIHAKMYFAAYDIGDDGSVPAAWDHTGWAWLCVALRDSAGEIGMTCFVDGDGSSEFGDGIGEGVLGRIDYLREAGDTGTPNATRIFYSSRVNFEDGTVLDQMLLSYGGIGQISTPTWMEDYDGDGEITDADWGHGYGGWNMNPAELRPDAAEPYDIDDTFARDWLASVAMKQATTRNGVPINWMNHSRCESWAGPHADGSYTCVDIGAPSLGWCVDNHVFWNNSAHTQVTVQPMMTLGSTGKADARMPGGFLPHLAGTAALANANWDGCAWPDQFVPDHIRTEDGPLDWGGPASLDADTYRFGKDPDLDLRVVFATNQMRGYCPPEAE